MTRFSLLLLAVGIAIVLAAATGRAEARDCTYYGLSAASLERVGLEAAGSKGEPNPEGPHGLRIDYQTPANALEGKGQLASIEVHAWMDGHWGDYGNSAYSVHQRVAGPTIYNTYGGGEAEESSSLLGLRGPYTMQNVGSVEHPIMHRFYSHEVYGPRWLWPEELFQAGEIRNEPSFIEIDYLAPGVGDWHVTLQGEYHTDVTAPVEGRVCSSRSVTVNGGTVE